jgi:hypothetical protein
LALIGMGSVVFAETDAANDGAPASPPLTLRHKIKAVNVDNHTVVVNRPGVVTLLLGTNEDSQDEARAAGVSVYPFQGRPDFQLIVVVDLRNSVATWIPTVVLATMRSNLDKEAIGLKPYYVKNGNKGNPRSNSCVIADFSGTICPLLGWPEGSENLRGILFGADGNEIKRWSKLEDMAKLQNEVRDAIQDALNTSQAKAAAAAKARGAKLALPPTLPPPLPPPVKKT